MTDVIVPLNSVKVPWFRDPASLTVFKGADYNARAVTVIGPRDFSRITFFATANPRRKLWEVQKADEEKLIVHEALWSISRTAEKVLAEVSAILAKTKISVADGWLTIPRPYLVPLLRRAANNVGVAALDHAAFAYRVREHETDKLQHQLKTAGVSPDIFEAYRVI